MPNPTHLLIEFDEDDEVNDYTIADTLEKALASSTEWSKAAEEEGEERTYKIYELREVA